ncbi:hypothetical protein DFH28DRAFT_950984 [Melampsora americana]|nr:hypothetical protein DFH28DRAFT_950984 [Melampsora americana]
MHRSHPLILSHFVDLLTFDLNIKRPFDSLSMVSSSLILFHPFLRKFFTCNSNSDKISYYIPSDGGGTSLNRATNSGLGEPLNVIISAQSSPEILTDSGIENFAKAIGFSQECLGLHKGDLQKANLGDGMAGRANFQSMLSSLNIAIILIHCHNE